VTTTSSRLHPAAARRSQPDRVLRETQQNSHRARFEFDARAVLGNLIKRGIDTPRADSKFPVSVTIIGLLNSTSA